MKGPVNESFIPNCNRRANDQAGRTHETCRPGERSSCLVSAFSAGLSLLVAGLLASGCSSGSPTSSVGVGAITFTDVNGTPQTKPPTSLTAGQSTYLDITLTNDPQNLGASWSVYCGSAPPPGTPPPPGLTQSEVCGTFTPVHTMSGPVPTYAASGAGYVTLYTAPAAPPAQGTVTLYAAATSNPSRWASVTLTIAALPISVGLAPAPPATLATGATTQIKAVVNNDAANAGVGWSTICASTDCGSFSPTTTASGAITTYTAPAIVPVGGSVQVVATSVTDPTKSASSTIAITAASASTITGSVQVSGAPVEHAQVSLYAALTKTTAENHSPKTGDAINLAGAITDADGTFSFPAGYRCPTTDSQLYLVATAGSTGAGINPDLALMAALGPCSRSGASRLVVNEATTAAAVYALSGFMVDTRQLGSANTSPDAIAAAFATSKDLVDVTTGLARTRTSSGAGIVPQAKINSLANLLSACARTAGSAPGDGNPCDQLFAATNPGKGSATRPADTIQALLNLVRNATGFRESPDSFATLYILASSNHAFDPALLVQPKEWTLAIVFPAEKGNLWNSAAMGSGGGSLSSPAIDAAGNVWIQNKDGSRIEFIGGASSAGAPNVLLPIAAELEAAP